MDSNRPPPRIITLSPEAIQRLLYRHRRSETLERYEPRLDTFLKELLHKANQLVPSESGAILLDDPRAKLFGNSNNVLTCIAAFGSAARRLLGTRVPCDEGPLGRVYRTAHSTCITGEYAAVSPDMYPAFHTPTSLLAVPVVVGNSVCGVLQLINRRAANEFTAENCTLLEIFAGYISSSLQNAIDTIRASEAARRDHLTGLFNDRYLHYELRRRIQYGQQHGRSTALLFIDLDSFKEINDSYGHLVGSRTLHELGLLLQAEIPQSATAARYGGDEFVVILDADEDQALALAKRLCQRIAKARLVEGAPDAAITLSIGVAAYRGQGPDTQRIPAGELAEELIRAADTAMYRVKEGGKNGVLVAENAGAKGSVKAPQEGRGP